MRRSILALVAFAAAAAAVHAAPVPNPSFEEGTGTPTGWVLSGAGAWATEGHAGKRCLALTGDGKSALYWKCEGWQPEPGRAYRLTFWAKGRGASGGCLTSGLSSANQDFPVTDQWQRYTRVFVAPRGLGDAFLRLGVWNVSGTVLFDDVSVTPVTPLNGVPGAPELGDGERIERGRYRFQAPFTGDGSNYARVLAEHTAGYNTSRWVLTEGSTVVYRHRVGDLRQRAGSLEVTIGYYVGGTLAIEASRDGQAWQPVGELAEKTSRRFDIPAGLFPAAEVWIRLSGKGQPRSGEDSHPGDFQVHAYTYEADLEGTPANASGRTAYLSIDREEGPARVAVQTLGGLRPDTDTAARLRIANPGDRPLRVDAELAITGKGGKPAPFRRAATVPAGGEAIVEIPYAVKGTGAMSAALRVLSGGQTLFAASTEFDVPALFAADYGYLVAGGADADVWWCEGTYKVSRERPAPTTRRPEVRVSAARHEYEPFQVILRPRRALTGVTARMEDLVGPGGARIPAANVRLCRVAYVNVTRPTDKVGFAGAWPDPLPPLDGPFDAAAGRNEPLWATVYVPPDAAPGDYTGRLRLSAGAWSQDVPVRLHVWAFALPKETHVQSAFGFSLSAVRRYHNLQSDADLAKVADLYYRNLAEHRISPYNPMELAPIKVTWGDNMAWQGGRQMADQPFEGARCVVIADTDPRASLAAATVERIAVDPAQEYRIAWAARTEKEGQTYLVTLQHYDAAGNWLSGRNADLRVSGTMQWKREEFSLKGRIPTEARFATITLRPAPWTEDGSSTGTAWFDAVSLRATAPLTPQTWGEPELVSDGGFEVVNDPSKVTVDFSAFDRAAEKAFGEYGFTSFRLGLQGMGGGTFHDRRYGRIGGWEQGTPEYETAFTAYARQIQDHLEQKGWLDKAYVYWFDEPEPRDYEFVKEGMALLKRAAPRLTRMLTEQVEPELAGSVDLWCPITNAYNAEQAHARQAAGERIWWYVCTGPKAPYATLFIDHPATEMRVWLWQTHQYNVQGILVWQSNYWTSGAAFPAPALQNPWEDPMSYVSGYSYGPGQVGYWGNGDGRFLYPANRDPNNDKAPHVVGPVDSFRWEMLREGIEDYEYFWLLRDAIAKAKARGASAKAIAAAERLLAVPADVCTDMTHFTTDPLPLYAHREKVARAIEGLGRQR